MAITKQINIIPDDSWQRIHVSQGDIGRTLQFVLYEGSTSYTIPTGATVKIQGTKPSGLGFSETCTWSGSTVTIDTTEAMTQEFGGIPTELQITDGDDVLGTSNFMLVVERNPHGDEVIDGNIDTFIPEMRLLVNQMGEYADEISTSYHSYGSPWVASTVAEMTDTDKIYVYVGSETGYTSGNWYYYDGSAWVSGGIYNSTAVQTDTTLSQSGVPADAKVVGDEITDLKNDLGDLADLETEDTSSIVNAINEVASGSSGSGLTADIKTALLQIAQKVAYIDANGQDYYDDLYDALYAITAISLNTNSISLQSIGATSQLTATTTPAGGNVTWSSSNTSVATVSSTGLVTSVAYGSATITATAGSVSATCSVVVAQATLTGISAVYTQSVAIYEDTNLDSLKSDLVVTASWSDSTTSTVASADYTLSGTLSIGISTITVSYGGQTDTFDVTVTSEEWTVVRAIGDNYETGRVSQSAGTVDASQTSWYTSSFIEVPDGATSYSRDTSRTSDWWLVWYDSEQAFLGNGETGTYSGNGIYGGGYTDGNGVLWNVVPSTAKYCKVSWRTNATYTSVTFAHNKIIDENTTPVVDKLYAYTYDPTATGNSFNNDDFLKCSGMAYAQIRPVQQRSVTFYDSDFLVVSTITRATNIGNNVAIPSDAVYLKCQCGNTITTASNNTTRIGTGLIMFTNETKTTW